MSTLFATAMRCRAAAILAYNRPGSRSRTQEEAMGKDVEVAILFADVVGSTQLYEQLGDVKARQMVGRCLDIMREATEANRRHRHQDHG